MSPVPHSALVEQVGAAVDVKGIVFAGTGTAERERMSTFVRDVLGLAPATVEGVEEISGDARERYVHVRAPDGQLDELVERRSRL